MDRRSFVTATIAFGLTGLAASVAGCTDTRPGTSQASRTTTPKGTTVTDAPRTKTLLVYFSRPGENYYYGDRVNLDVGNTQVVADMIAARIGVDTYRIEAADPYPTDYEATVERNVREQQADARPAFAGTLPSLDGYDTLLIGSPVWNVQAPMIMRTFIEGVDLAGKTIHPFVTYAVSGMGSVRTGYQRWCSDSNVTPGLAIQGEKALDSGPQVGQWLRREALAT